VPPVTASDLAAELGLSKTTVCRALQHDPRVRASTRAKVEALAKERGYSPDPALSALSQTRWRSKARARTANLGFLAVASDESEVTRQELFQFSAEEAAARGFELIPLTINPRSTRPQLRRLLESMNIRCVLVDRLPASIAKLPSFDPEMIPWDLAAWVLIGEGSYRIEAHRVRSNSFRDALTAFEQLVQKGHHRILFAVEGKEFGPVVQLQTAAFLLARHEHPEVEFHLTTPEEVEHQLRRVLPDPEGVTVLTAFPFFAWKPPKALPMRGWATLRLHHQFLGRCAGILLDLRERVSAAFDLIDREYRRGARGLPKRRLTIQLESAWVDGDSLGDA